MKDPGKVSCQLIVIFFCLSGVLHAQSDGVVFWNKMEIEAGNALVSEVGPDLSLSGTSWSFSPAMFNDGWDNHSESAYAFGDSASIVAGSREGAFAFWWVPDDDADTVIPGKVSWFISNGSTNFPANDHYGLEFDYVNYEPSFDLYLWKRTASGTMHSVGSSWEPGLEPGDWVAGDRVHVAVAWHNEPVILGQYIAAIFVDGELLFGWTDPTFGTLEGWRVTNPAQFHHPDIRFGDSHFPYSVDEQLRGPMDNIIFWDYAKSDFSDRFNESPLSIPVPLDVKPGSCPNPLNVKSRGLFPVAILGTPDLDVEQVDLASIRLDGVAPIRSSMEDVAEPFAPFTGKEHCELDCNDWGPDGRMDITLKFRTVEIVAALGEFQDGDCRVLTLTGNLKEEFGEIPLEGEDVVLILNKGRGGRPRFNSRLPVTREGRTPAQVQRRD